MQHVAVSAMSCFGAPAGVVAVDMSHALTPNEKCACPASSKGVPVAAGLMFGPAALGLLADFTSVQTALCANAAVLALVMGFFVVTARETRRGSVAAAVEGAAA